MNMNEPQSIRVKLQPKQAELYRLMQSSDATWIGYGGSRGGAKSGGARRVMLQRRVENPGTVGMIFRRTYPDLLDNHIEPMWRDFPQLRQFYNVGEKSIKLPNKSAIVFRYGENPTAIQSFLGKEYMDIYVDQAEALTEQELVELQTSCRWTGLAGTKCKFVLGFNPGGKGTAFLKRIFRDRKYREGEKAEEYKFIQAYGWDNIEWARPWLEANAISEKTYYSEWTDDERQQCFLEHSAYGRSMLALPKGLRIGWLYGDFDNFSGQYFDNWDPAIHVRTVRNLGLEAWHQRWIAIDWGYAHNCAVMWGAKTPSHVAVYRELVVNRMDEAAIAQRIAELSHGEDISAVFLSPDAKAKRGSAKPTREQLGEELQRRGLPYPSDADNQRVAGWRMMHRMLGDGESLPELLIADTCQRLIECIPSMSRKDNNPEDCEKFDCNEEGVGGDDTCVARGTMILTDYGTSPIENIRPGDRVATRAGFRMVRAALQTASMANVVELRTQSGLRLVATCNHPVLAANGFVRLDSLRYGDIIGTCCKRSCSKGSPTPNSTGIIAPDESFYTAKFGSRPMGRFLRGFTSTIEMAIALITNLVTSNAFLRRSTAPSIHKYAHSLIAPASQQPDGTEATPELNGIGDTPDNSASENRNTKYPASIAGQRPPSEKRDHDSVPIDASLHGGERQSLITSANCANAATSNSNPIGTSEYVFAQDAVLSITGVGVADVFNLAVDGPPEYVANGIVSHNCDAIRYLLLTYFNDRPMPREAWLKQTMAENANLHTGDVGRDLTVAAIAQKVAEAKWKKSHQPISRALKRIRH